MARVTVYCKDGSTAFVFPIDAKSYVANDPENWSYDPWESKPAKKTTTKRTTRKKATTKK